MEITEGQKKHRKLSLDAVPGLEELNLVEFPVALLADRLPTDLKTVEFLDSIRDDATGRRVERRVTVTGADKWGLPNWQDMDVLLGLMALTNAKHRFADRTVHFSLYELRELLGWPNDGRYKSRLKVALKRLLGVTVCFENSWRKGDRWISVEAFHLLDNLRLTNTREEFDAEEEQVFKWNDVVTESIQTSHSKGLDWPFYISLKLPSSKRLYRFLDKRFSLRDRWSYEVSAFCQEKLGMSRSYRAHDYKKKLKPAISELEARGFLAPLAADDRFRKEGKGLFYVELGRARKRVPPRKQTPAPRKESTPLEAALRLRGVNNAAELVSKYPAEKIEQQIENFDDRNKHAEDKAAGWLRSAIESPEGFGFRKGFRPKAVRAAEAQAREEKKRAAAEREREKHAAEEQQYASQQARIREYLETLSDVESEALRQQAEREADGFLRELVRRCEREGDDEGAARWREQIVEFHVKKLVAVK